jgi:hypothetical protein
MTTYFFHLCSLLGDPEWWNRTGVEASGILSDYFRPIVGRHTGFQDVMGSLMPDAASVGDKELLVYIVPNGSSFSSVIARRARSGWTPSTSSGLTFDIGSANGGAVSICSEVYWDRVEGDSQRSRLLANLIFHEFMHNKLDAAAGSTFDVHTRGGGGLATRDPINHDMRPNDHNMDLMARALNTRHAQFTGNLRASDVPPARPLRP